MIPSPPPPDLSALSTRELLQLYRTAADDAFKAKVLEWIRQKNPHITHLAKVYTLASSTEVLRYLPSTDALDNKFVSRPDAPIGKVFALLPGLLPQGASVELLAEDRHYQAEKAEIAVVQIKMVIIDAEQTTMKIGQVTWTTRSNVSEKADGQGFYKIIKPTANLRQEPIAVQGKMRLPAGKRVYIDVVKIDDYIKRNTYGLAVDAETQEEYGWITTTALEGKMNNEAFDYREAPYNSTEPGHYTVGSDSAAVVTYKGLHFALKKETYALNTRVKILQEADHYAAKGITRVAEIQGTDGTNLGWTTRTNLSAQADQDGLYKITDPNANVRNAPLPVYETTAKIIPQGAYIKAEAKDKAFRLDAAGRPEEITVSKITVYRGIKIVPEFADLWTLSLYLVRGWADFKGPNAKWYKGNYIGQTALLDVIGEGGNGGRQIAMTDRLGAKVEQMLRDARQEGIPLSVVSGFRDYKKQEQLARDQPGNAAKPGRSEHQAGNSLDLNNMHNSTVYEWLKRNAWKYGLVQTYPWALGTNGGGGEGHHWDYRPELAREGYYTYFINAYNPGVTFGTEKGQIDPKVKSTETWITGNDLGNGKGDFRIVETATGKPVELRKN